MKAMLRFWLALFIVLGGVVPVLAASSVSTEHVAVKLLADKASVAPGDTVTIAIVQDIIPEWHTYWRNPGDSGIAPALSWVLPPGYTVSPVQWPPPQRLAYGPLVNFGYADHVILLTDVKVPPEAQVGNPARLTTNFSWLVCQETCIPENAELDISVPVEVESHAAAANIDLFFRARQSVPQPALFPTQLSSDAKTLTLTVHNSVPASAFFYPFKPGLIDDSSPQLVQGQGDSFTLQLVRGELKQPFSSLEGVLEMENDKGRQTAFTVTATVPEMPAAVAVPPTETGILAALGLAVLGGIILNLMPCVFPVLSLKVLAVARHADGQHREAAKSGIYYTLGIFFAFTIIAVLLLALRAAGGAIGWGFQLQSPPFVLFLSYLLFAMGLSLSGFFTLQGRFINLGAGLTARAGAIGSFFTGALAALVATPCSAPFMGTAVGYAVTQPWPIALVIIEALGLGLALPYLVLTLNPRLIRLMPRPGIWMERLKQFLAFPLYCSAVWLLWVLSLQTGPSGVLIALGGAVLLSFGLWSFTVSRHADHRLWRRIFAGVAILALIAAGVGATSPVLWQNQSQAMITNSFIPPGWESFSKARLDQLRKEGTPVFIDMSAAWCITCVVNEKIALGPDMVKDMSQKGIVLLKGDWTNQDPQITALLSSFGRSGVPLYVYYPPAQMPAVVLPQILSTGIVLHAIGS